MNQKKLMLLGGIRYLLPVIEAAHKLGAYVITADYLPDNIAHKYSDEYVNVSILDREAVLKVAQEKQIDGILSFGVDPGVITAAYVADRMGLPFPPLKSVEILQNKDKFRDFLAANGFNCPFHFSYAADDDPLKDDRLMQKLYVEKFPVIVKPVDSAGSKGCSKYDPNEDVHSTTTTPYYNNSLSQAIANARSESHNGRIIIEQFLEKVGHSSDTDSFSIDNELVYCSFNCQHFDAKANNPYTPSGYTWPSDMPIEAQAELRSELSRLIKLLNLGTHVYNIETRFCTDGKPYIMELSPRGGGNRLSEVLRLATGVDLIRACVAAALGLPKDSNIRTFQHSNISYNGSWAEVIVHSNKSGIYRGVDILPEVKSHLIQKDIWVKPGDAVEEFTGANKTIGTLVLRFDTHAEAERALDTVDEWLKVVVA